MRLVPSSMYGEKPAMCRSRNRAGMIVTRRLPSTSSVAQPSSSLTEREKSKHSSIPMQRNQSASPSTSKGRPNHEKHVTCNGQCTVFDGDGHTAPDPIRRTRRPTKQKPDPFAVILEGHDPE